MTAPQPTPHIRLAPLPASFAATRETIHRLAAHVLARRRYAVSGKFGLRATPGGIGTPAFGPEHEVLRITTTTLLREQTTATAATIWLDLSRATLADAATLAGVDVSQTFEVGQDTPPLGDPDTPLGIDPAATQALAEWFRYGWAILDTALATAGPQAQPSVIQLWPEHFDAAFDLAVRPGRRTTLGASPGDSYCPQPYLYVGPWGTERPGDPSYWNAPFGAVLPYDKLCASDDAVPAGVAFLHHGINLLRS
ncbi:MAG TPA: hypothetical protein VN748_00015 [Pseudonocardiaceae bacterium]|jgi:hypothetical protein|nr:hypothetical protein [Pseudonocardiaceae bacterium]